MRNEYEVRGNVVAIFLNTKKYGRMETLISKSQLEKAKLFPYTWRTIKDSRRNVFYVIGDLRLANNKKKIVLLHRWLTNAPKGKEVDHINHLTLDNRSENLRIVTPAENQQNRRGAARNSTTKIRGVYWHKQVGKWHAQIRINGKRISVGYYTDIKEAERAVKAARRQHMPFCAEDIS